jgi:cyclohexyl-isocyanide hydratase
MLLFPALTQIDFTEPYEVFARMPETTVHIVAKTLEPVRSERGLMLVPTVTCADCPPLDVLVVPGGPGQHYAMNDEVLLDFLQRQAAQAEYVTSVCTGALLLGAAGLLDGYRATTHWLSMRLLELYGAIPVERRVVVDRNRVTASGCSAGLDFALTLAAMLAGDAVAQQVQLQLEYCPAPPFASGSPAAAPAEIVAKVRRAAEPFQRQRRQRQCAGRTDGRRNQMPRRGRTMLELRPNCECCDKDLPPAATDAMICTFECTFCRDCVQNRLGGVCPNCGGNFAPRPLRPPAALLGNPPSTLRVYNPQGCGRG